MALSKSSLKGRVESELVAVGFDISNEHCASSKMAQAIANAVIDEITSNGQVVVTGGSSSGTYKVS